MATAVIAFDVGGTLIHPDFVELGKWTLQRTGVNLSATVVERAFRIAIAGDVLANGGNETRTQASRYFSLCGCPVAQSLHWVNWWSEIINAGGAGSWLYKRIDPEAIETFLRLRELNCHLIAASNSDGTLLEELRLFGLLQYFDNVYDSSILGVAKPSLEFYRHVLSTTRCDLSVHVGDDLIKDVIAVSATDFARALLYDPARIYEGLPSHLRIFRLSDLPRAIGIQ
jgi:FMN phosphatase YigB (HAD superfamily)